MLSRGYFLLTCNRGGSNRCQTDSVAVTCASSPVDQAMRPTVARITSPRDAGALRGRVVMEHPNKLIDSFTGTVELEGVGPDGGIARCCSRDMPPLPWFENGISCLVLVWPSLFFFIKQTSLKSKSTLRQGTTKVLYILPLLSRPFGCLFSNIVLSCVSRRQSQEQSGC